MRRTRVIAAVLCAGMLVPTAAVATPAPPQATEQHLRGGLVSAERIGSMSRAEVAAYLTGYDLDPATARHGVELYRVTYRTTGADGRPTTATALTVLPRTGRPAPTVAWLHGTRVYRGDTGSLSDNLDRAAAVLFASAGHATVAPDYLGLGGGPGHHPYMLSRPTVTATVDALRASRAVASRADRRLDRRVLVAGFSQGGQAAMVVGRALQGSREFGLTGIGAIAGPHDIRGQELPAALDGRLDGISAVMYLGYAITAWNRAHPLYGSPSEVFRAPYGQVVESLFDSDHQEGDVVMALPHTPAELFTDGYLAELANPDGELAEVLAANDDPCEWRPRVPVRLYAGTADRDVVFANSESCQSGLAARGTRDSRVVNVGDVDHFTSARLALPQVLAFFDRLR